MIQATDLSLAPWFHNALVIAITRAPLTAIAGGGGGSDGGGAAFLWPYRNGHMALMALVTVASAKQS